MRGKKKEEKGTPKKKKEKTRNSFLQLTLLKVEKARTNVLAVQEGDCKFLFKFGVFRPMSPDHRLKKRPLGRRKQLRLFFSLVGILFSFARKKRKENAH